MRATEFLEIKKEIDTFIEKCNKFNSYVAVEQDVKVNITNCAEIRLSLIDEEYTFSQIIYCGGDKLDTSKLEIKEV